MLCMSSIVKTDSEAEVRRAAALCIRLLVEGLGEEAVIVSYNYFNFCSFFFYNFKFIAVNYKH